MMGTEMPAEAPDLVWREVIDKCSRYQTTGDGERPVVLLSAEEKASVLFLYVTEYGVMDHESSVRPIEDYLDAVGGPEAFAATLHAAKLNLALAGWHRMHLDHSVSEVRMKDDALKAACRELVSWAEAAGLDRTSVHFRG